MLNFLCLIDIFGKEINLQIKSYQVYKTPVGGVLTLFIGVVTLVAIWFFGKDIIYKEQPSYLTKKLSLPKWPFIRLNNKDFFFGIRVEDNYGNFLTNPKYFEVLFEYDFLTLNMSTKQMEKSIETIRTPGVPCNTSNVDNETLVKETLDTFMCFNFDSKNITLGGDWSSDSIGYMTYFIQKCNKETEKTHNITCATDEEYVKDNDYGDLFYAGLKYSNYIVDPSSLDKALTKNFIYTYQSISRKIRKQNRVFYTTSALETDKGWLFNETIYEKYTTVEKNSIDFMNVGPDNYIFESPVYITNLQNYNVRNYLKIQDVAANVGGIMSIAFFIFKFVYGFYVDNNYLKYLFETLVQFNEKTEDQADGDEDNANFYPQNMKKVAPMLNTASVRTQMHDNILKSDTDSATGKDIKSLNLRFQGQKDNQDLSSVNRLHIIPQNLEATKNENQKIQEESIYNNEERSSENFDNLPVKNNESKYIQYHNPSNNASYLNDAIVKKKSKRDVQVPIHISETELFKYLFCRCCSLNKVKNQLIFFAQRKIEENLEVTNLLRALDQVKLLKKVVLNSEQCFMLDNKGRFEVTNQILASKGITKVDEDDPIIYEEKFKIKKDKLAKYFKAKKEEENISKLDEYLFLHLEKNTKQYVSKEAGVQDFC